MGAATFADGATLLQIRDLRVVYGRAVEAVRNVSVTVRSGRIVALLGANGAGKSSILKAVAGLLPSEGGEVAQGEILIEGTSIVGHRPDEILRRGVALVPEGRRLFAPLTVRENLDTGGFTRSDAERRRSFDRVMGLFPDLADRLDARAGFLSGGQQQMVAIGRALMANPRLVMLDEPSLGLAPLVVRDIFETLRKLRDEEGLTILLIEQNARLALALADEASVIESGRVMLEGAAGALTEDPRIRGLYLGHGSDGTRRSVRERADAGERARWPA